MNAESHNDCWEALADDWDARIGDDGNKFHRELIRPATLRLLSPQPSERIFDAACGNGVFARYLAARNVNVVAFDFSPQMIAHARKRCAPYLERISFSVADATDYNQLIALGGGAHFDKAVANMAVMDISDIKPLFRAVYDMLKPEGAFVFSAVHPCFQTPGQDYTPDGSGLVTRNYIKPQRHAAQILRDNDKRAWHWHRPLHELLGTCFDAGFVLDGLEEPMSEQCGTAHSAWEEIPLSIVLRARKNRS